MPIQKSFTKPDQTSGDFWRILNVSISTEADRPGFVVIMALWKDQATVGVSGATPMMQRQFTLPISAFTQPQLNVLKNVIQNWLVANEPTFSGGTII